MSPIKRTKLHDLLEKIGVRNEEERSRAIDEIARILQERVITDEEAADIFRTHEVFTVEEVAAIIKASLSNCYAVLKQGKLKSFKVGSNGGGLRVRKEDLERYMAGDETEPEPAVETVELRNLRK